jgi:predicted ester cyclase
VADEAIIELYRREITPELYDEIRELWKRHSIAEDARDLPGLISTLTEDCVYELVGTGRRWEGHAGATRFYAGLLTAFPDISFALTDIVIGPQGVCEEADVTATHLGEWLGQPPTGEWLSWKVVIFFPWDTERRLFRGEKVYTAGLQVPAVARAAERAAGPLDVAGQRGGRRALPGLRLRARPLSVRLLDGRARALLLRPSRKRPAGVCGGDGAVLRADAAPLRGALRRGPVPLVRAHCRGRRARAEHRQAAERW